MSSEFWLISVPGDRENLEILERMNNFTAKSNLSRNTNFPIPDFKVGTLDSLVILSDELGKLDPLAESLVKRMTQYVSELTEAKKGEVQEHLLANGVTLASFVTHFEWDIAKYPSKQPLGAIGDTLAKQLAQMDTDLQTKITAYNKLKRDLENIEKKFLGSLFTRTLSDLVSKEDFVLDSEYLITLLVIVPKASYSLWQKTYESLSDMVVPRSTKLIVEDNESGLFTVTMFRKVLDDFKAKAKAHKFTVRDFFYDEKEIQMEREELIKLLLAKKQQHDNSRRARKNPSISFLDQVMMAARLVNPFKYQTKQIKKAEEIEIQTESEGYWESPFLCWLKVNFGEVFVIWIHIKALRVFVESVLRYGLPVSFKAVLLQPQKKSPKRLREIVNSAFRHVDEVAASIMDSSLDMPGLQLSNQDYFPYVYFNIGLKFLD
ncbi:V-type proton ATPase subunit C 2-like [Dromiciops gliroides]|uniref:V-type proton ATPase subunit C 2-like n=1 Tax=Dromiciops gliroides TaxID=33562 RepID=UPI001CC5D142|nr:V-type proton ATPase subunit C 2-like [Dromiciops gliroides]